MGLGEELLPLTRLRWLQQVVLAAMLVLVGAVAFQLKFSVIDLDVWWHLKVGDWIVQNGAFPHTGILSRSAADRPWAAYSWGYEVLLSRFYAGFGILGIGIYGTLLTLMVAFSLYYMTRRLSGRFWLSCVLASACAYAFLFLMMPRPVFFSIALLCVTLTLILEANRDGSVRRLYWLPLVFLVWANLHIQFIYGLAVVGLLAGVSGVQELAGRFGFAMPALEEAKLPFRKLAMILGLCFLATLMSPYSYRLYGIILNYSRSQLIYSMIKELQPLSFRGYENYVELLLAGAAFFVVGRRKKISLFALSLLCLASVFAFRTMRDSWFLCVASTACIAGLSEAGDREDSESPQQLAAVFALAAIGLAAFAPGMQFNARGLDAAVSSMFPVDAVNFVRQNRLPGPLYNNFDWGGFLTWYMPDYPVVIDGRTDLYGDELNQLLVGTENGEGSYQQNPYLDGSRLVLLRRRQGLAPVLALDPRFRKVYQDNLAVVFVRQ